MKVITSTNNKNLNAGPKAKMDVIYFLKEIYKNEVVEETFYYNETSSKNPIKKMLNKSFNFLCKFKIIIKNINYKDMIIIQYPLMKKVFLLNLFPKKNTVILIHDLQGLRSNNLKQEKKEIYTLKKFQYIIAHNEQMKKYLVTKGIDSKKIYTLNLFDYAVNSIPTEKNKNKGKLQVIFTGNLEFKKAKFLYEIEEKKLNYDINVYGVGIDINKIKNNKRIHYCGCFKPNNLENIDGDIGLIWDGSFNEKDENSEYKNYSKYNNPHKLSCYLAMGKPVIAWKKSAIAEQISKKNIGYLISNIYDINNLDFSDYEEKKKNAEKIGYKVRKGYFIRKVISEIIR